MPTLRFCIDCNCSSQVHTYCEYLQVQLRGTTEMEVPKLSPSHSSSGSLRACFCQTPGIGWSRCKSPLVLSPMFALESRLNLPERLSTKRSKPGQSMTLLEGRCTFRMCGRLSWRQECIAQPTPRSWQSP